jgi:hypothetical protein
MYISFSIVVFLQGFFAYFSLHVHVYIRASGPLMNTSAIHNNYFIETLFRNRILLLDRIAPE